MNASRHFLFPLALLVTIGASAIGVWQAQATHRAEVAHAAIDARRADLERWLDGRLGRLVSGEPARMEAERQSRGADAASLGAEISAVAARGLSGKEMAGLGQSGGAPGATEVTSASELSYSVVETREDSTGWAPPREDPAMRRMKLELKYGGFLAQLELSADQKTRFLDILHRQEEAETDLAHVAEAGKLPPNDSTIINMHEEIAARNWAAVRELLGEEKAEQVRQYERASYSRDTVTDWVGDAALVGITFDFPQLMQLAQAIHATRVDGDRLGEIDWERANVAVRPILTSEQFAFVERRIKQRTLEQKSSAVQRLVEKTLDIAPGKIPAR